jgi:putative glutamine amidotransferase
MKKPAIGIADCRHHENYAHWISSTGEVTLIKLGHKLDNLSDIEKCDALFLTGGEDVHPRFYQRPEYVDDFRLTDLDERRDEFELELLGKWKALGIPLLGVCRGQQLTNVFLGGTLIPDLPAYGKYNHGRKEGKPRLHSIQVDPNSQMLAWMPQPDGMVTSVHHQSVDHVGGDLVANALSPDGVVEGLEWREPKDKPDLLLVQWHPELMSDHEEAFSKGVRDHFLEMVKNKLQG